jgi:hypothetical protein
MDDEYRKDQTNEYAHVLFFYQYFDQALDFPVRRDRYFEGLSAAYLAVRAFLVFESVRIYPFCTDEHEIVVEVCC